ncbi:MAG: DNA methyltransferase [Rugosibacter sp.]
MSTSSAIESFIVRWTKASGSERANYQLFVTELCRLLDVEPPQPAFADAGENAYVFERRVTFRHGDGSESAGFIDCYRRGAFVLEAKKLKTGGAQTFDDALLRARAQAENYARALPATEGRPPFLVVVDVGNVIELYSEFSRSGATYTPYPDPRSHRIAIADFLRDDIRERLRLLFTDPLALDPSRQTARVTREIAAHLAEVAKSLEGAGHAAEAVAGFLTRCLFSMFAEDVALIPKGAFSELLKSLKEAPEQFAPMIGELWRAMDKGEFSIAIRAALPRFNGKLFKSPEAGSLVLPVTKQHIQLLIEAAKADWTQVEPAIFGTLLERALDPQERHALGAHYTPRAYVERLVLPTVIEPLRRHWANVQAAAVLHANAGRHKEAVAELRNFHHHLCALRVLDPACGSGNFLYVTLEHMKRLEGEVLNQLHDLGETQSLLEAEGLTVDPHQFLGLELNPRAAAIAELVLWIGYLQWHFRTQGSGLPPSPILKDFKNIQCADAVLAFDRVDFVLDEQGIPVSRWDGRSFKTHPVTGEQVPDEAARTPLQRYNNPRRAAWPTADVVVGNPPFIGKGNIRAALGDGYVDALRSVWGDVPESADFVMFWWHHAAQLVAQGEISRFGFITTNSLRQTFNRRIVQAALDKGLHLAFAIPDHPWVETSDGAAVRIAMTVAAAGMEEGRLCTVSAEREGNGEGLEVELTERSGSIHADLSVGANVAAVHALRVNEGLSSNGYMLAGSGFIVTPKEAAHLEADAPLKPYRNGRDLTDRPRDVKLIDLFGFEADDVRRRWPATFQWVLERVKPERDANRDVGFRTNWWLFGRPRPNLRDMLAGLPRYIATVETAKHRTFQFLDATIAPDHMLIVIALDDAYFLGVLSSRVHVVWALATGGRLGVGNDPRYNKSRCFETFPFPAATPAQQARIRDLAEQIDAHRKRVLATHNELTLTSLYNVMQKVGAGGATALQGGQAKNAFLAVADGDTASAAPLTAKERVIHDKGLVAVLHSLHTDLDAAVLDAYGWSDLVGNGVNDETLLERLVALNRERTSEEAQGQIRWLRPSFQNPAAQPAQQSLPATPQDAATAKIATASTPADRQPWPATLPEQMATVAHLLAVTATPLDMTAIAAHFTGKGKWKSALPEILATLEALGRARQVEAGLWVG